MNKSHQDGITELARYLCLRKNYKKLSISFFKNRDWVRLFHVIRNYFWWSKSKSEDSIICSSFWSNEILIFAKSVSIRMLRWSSAWRLYLWMPLVHCKTIRRRDHRSTRRLTNRAHMNRPLVMSVSCLVFKRASTLHAGILQTSTHPVCIA